MIKRQLRSGTYSFPELSRSLAKSFIKDEDGNIFIEAMVKTGQILKQYDQYILPIGEVKELLKPKYYAFPLISGGEGDRVAIRQGKEWVTKYGVPSVMYLLGMEKSGIYKRIKENIPLIVSKGRLPETTEAFRAQIPTSVQREYNITKEDIVHIRIDELTKDYFTNLRLWGFEYLEMIAFMYKSKEHTYNDRALELTAYDIIHPTYMSISENIENTRNKIKYLMMELLEKAEPEYHNLILNFEEYDTGSTHKPLMKKTDPPPFPKITFKDLKSNKIILYWRAYSPFSDVLQTTDFVLTDYVNQNLKIKRGFINRGGFE
jgi:hypothetical protein